MKLLKALLKITGAYYLIGAFAHFFGLTIFPFYDGGLWSAYHDTLIAMSALTISLYLFALSFDPKKYRLFLDATILSGAVAIILSFAVLLRIDYGALGAGQKGPQTIVETVLLMLFVLMLVLLRPKRTDADKNNIGAGVGALIVNDKGETLLIKRGGKSKNESGVWSKPGGTIEYGETAKEAVIREIKEELGVEIEVLDNLGFTDHILPHENQHWLAVHFLAKIVKGEPRNMEPHKIAEIRWFSLDDLPDNITQTTREPAELYIHTKGKSA